MKLKYSVKKNTEKKNKWKKAQFNQFFLFLLPLIPSILTVLIAPLSISTWPKACDPLCGFSNIGK